MFGTLYALQLESAKSIPFNGLERTENRITGRSAI
jgi:hypothetical protein